jgi:hypothetical protein
MSQPWFDQPQVAAAAAVPAWLALQQQQQQQQQLSGGPLQQQLQPQAYASRPMMRQGQQQQQQQQVPVPLYSSGYVMTQQQQQQQQQHMLPALAWQLLPASLCESLVSLTQQRLGAASVVEDSNGLVALAGLGPQGQQQVLQQLWAVPLPPVGMGAGVLQSLCAGAAAAGYCGFPTRLQ